MTFLEEQQEKAVFTYDTNIGLPCDGETMKQIVSDVIKATAESILWTNTISKGSIRKVAGKCNELINQCERR